MKELFKRFDINIDIKEAQNQFINKINNILLYSEQFKTILNDLHWGLGNKIGIKFNEHENLGNLLENINFNEYLLRIQCIINYYHFQFEKEFSLLFFTIKRAIKESPIDLGIKLDNNYQIVVIGSEYLDEKLINDILGVLKDPDKEAIRMAFEKGLKEFLESQKDNTKFKNAVRDMQLACDETIKFMFNDKNLGFKHLFDNDRWGKIGLNKYQKQIFWNLNEYIDKLAKHKADAEINCEDAENVIYLTGMFIRLVFLKNNHNTKFTPTG